MSAKLALLPCPVLLAFLGCDPCRTIEQTVQISVARNDGSHVTNDLRLRIREIRERTAQNAEFYDADPNYRFASMWFTGRIDGNGKVIVAVTEGAIDRTRTGPPVHRDAITGRTFEFEILDGNNHIQAGKTVFRRGAVVVGEVFTLEVLSISEPCYLKEDEAD